MFLTGSILEQSPWQGWDLEPYDTTKPPINYSPQIDPNVTSPDFSLGGILIYNPTGGEVEIQMLVMA